MRTFRQATLALALSTFAVAGCRDMPQTLGPTPVQAAVVTSVFASGPGGLSPGESGQFMATVYYRNRPPVTVTQQAAWSTSSPDILTIGPDGVGVAHAAGMVTVKASYQGWDGSTSVVVLSPATRARRAGRAAHEGAVLAAKVLNRGRVARHDSRVMA